MSKEELHRNNPLQGVGLKTVLEELVTYYGFDILYAYLNMNCFKSNPSIAASAKFLKKTDWAREKVELFYLYQYKNLPKVSSEQFNVAPRERIVPADHKPGKPALLSIEDGERLHHKREKNVASRNSFAAGRHGSSRAYNSKRNTRQQDKPGGDHYADDREIKPSDNAFDDESEANEPAVPFNPWTASKRNK